MLLPALAQLTAGARVTVVGRSPGVDLLRPHADRCMNFEKKGWHTLFMHSPQGGFMPSLSGIDATVAFSADSERVLQTNLQNFLPKSAIHVFPPFPPAGSGMHTARYLARCLQEADLPVDPEAAMASAIKQALLACPGTAQKRKTRIVFHPGSGSPKKNYPPGLWAALFKALKHGRHPMPGAVSLLLGPAEEDARSLYDAPGTREAWEILCSPPMESLLSLLGESALYIGLDSGITHVAAMCGTPTLALFKSTSVSEWRPLGPRVRVLKANPGDASLVDRVIRETRTMMP